MNSRTFQLAGTLVSHVETDEKVVALTFDDGPTARTPELLATLDAADVPATFYLIGKDLAAHPEYGKQIVDAGHEIGNHSFSHRRMVFVTPGTVRDEIERTDAEIHELMQEAKGGLVALTHALATHALNAGLPPGAAPPLYALTPALARYQALRQPRCQRIVKAANDNARNYHLQGPARAVAHAGLRAVSTLAPARLIERFAWLYDYDPTAL